MNKFPNVFFIILLYGTIFCSCKSDKKPLLPSVTGKPGEVILVIDKYVWESGIGSFFSDLFSQPCEALPQDEPIYDLIHIPSGGFSNIFKSHRNIILMKISSNQKKPRIIVQRDVWAKYQIVLNVVGPNDSTTINYLNSNRVKIVDLLNHAERQRTIENYKKNRAKGIDETMRKKHHVSISVPTGYTLDVDSPDFVWISHEIADLTQGILIYHYQYTDPNTFTIDYLIQKRNEFLQKYVPGPVKNSYMSTEPLFTPIFREFNKDGEYLVELRGLWKLVNAYMGGPFISFIMLDEKRNRIVTIEGFVFAPSLDKRNYIRQLEAILYTFEIVE